MTDGNRPGGSSLEPVALELVPDGVAAAALLSEIDVDVQDDDEPPDEPAHLPKPPPAEPGSA